LDIVFSTFWDSGVDGLCIFLDIVFSTLKNNIQKKNIQTKTISKKKHAHFWMVVLMGCLDIVFSTFLDGLDIVFSTFWILF